MSAVKKTVTTKEWVITFIKLTTMRRVKVVCPFCPNERKLPSELASHAAIHALSLGGGGLGDGGQGGGGLGGVASTSASLPGRAMRRPMPGPALPYHQGLGLHMALSPTLI